MRNQTPRAGTDQSQLSKTKKRRSCPFGVTNQSFPEEHHATLAGVASAPRSSELLQGSFFEKWRTTFQEQSTPENGFKIPDAFFVKSKGQFGPFNSNRSLHIYVLNRNTSSGLSTLLNKARLSL
jgi:hypothetical protein